MFSSLLRFVIRSNLKLAQLNVIPLSLFVEKLLEGCLVKSWTRVEEVERDLVCGTQPKLESKANLVVIIVESPQSEILLVMTCRVYVVIRQQLRQL